MSINDLAGGGDAGSYDPELLYAGEAPVVTDAAPLVGAITVAKYEVVTMTATGIRKIVAGGGTPDTGDKCVIAAQPVAGAGNDCPYFAAGKFNHAALVWPPELSTYALRRAFFAGTGIHIGRIA